MVKRAQDHIVPRIDGLDLSLGTSQLKKVGSKSEEL